MNIVHLQCVIVRATLALSFVSTNSSSPLVTMESFFVVVQSNSIMRNTGNENRTRYKLHSRVQIVVSSLFMGLSAAAISCAIKSIYLTPTDQYTMWILMNLDIPVIFRKTYLSNENISLIREIIYCKLFSAHCIFFSLSWSSPACAWVIIGDILISDVL